MVQIEITRAVLLQVDHRCSAIFDDRADIRAAMRRIAPAANTQRHQRRCDAVRDGIGGFGHIELHAPDLVSAEIGFHRDGVLVIPVRFAIGIAAEYAHFLGTGPKQADCPFRFARRHDLFCRGGDDAAAGPVIDCTRTQIPAVEMTCQQDHRQLRVAARQLGDDVARWLLAQVLRRKNQFHAHRLASGKHAGQVFRIGNGQRRRGYRCDAILERRTARVRIAMIVGPDRADNDRRCAFLGGGVRTDPAGGAISAIAGAVLSRFHGMADKGDLAGQTAFWRGLQIGQRGEIDDLGFESIGSGAGTVAQRGETHFLGKRADDLARFRAADPGIHHVVLDADVLEPQ